ncbi:MAG: 4Fe-4S dicluster domain-containing protein, partial [Cyclobacteriaceae bacterium]|nr:4Fe-4S dicluster domain-containing protein [Cyclobacteriaceae bacterium]
YAHPLYPEGKDYEDVWTIRKKGLGLMLGMKGRKKPLPFIEDAGIPVEHLPEYIEKVLDLCHKEGAEVAMYAHASVGVIHVRPILDLREEEDIVRLANIADKTFDLVQHYKGSWSGEHGDGLVRSWYNKPFFGDQIYNALIDVKKLFDPDNLMNPGKIVEAQRVDENLRYGKDYAITPPETLYHYRDFGGFEDAVDMCTGVGECRKPLGGTMCPSFKALGDEEHSTRGRANLLRLAMSGQLGKEGLTNPRLIEALSLCLSCKACKSECPSNVDMARLKSEVLQLHRNAHGTTFRDKLVAGSSASAALFSGAMASLVNAVSKQGWFRKAMEKTAGLDARRTMPAYAVRSFGIISGKIKQPRNTDKKVVLFVDTYTNYHQPEIGVAAVKLLNDCGYRVEFSFAGCCQRTRISHGYLKEARKDGEVTLNNLNAYFEKGLDVVVLEPSCASALVDDLPDLIADENLGKKAKKSIMTIENFLAAEKAKGNLKVKLRAKKPLAIHGHCHQKSIFGTASMTNLLEDSHVKELPTGCCGMAGSFGYEKEHYELSKKVFDNSFGDYFEKKNNGEQVIADGMSCRHQIADFGGKKAVHWVEAVEVEM